MGTRTILALVAILVAGAAMAQAYRWVDEDGVVHYSDRPQPGAERIVLPEPNTVSVPRRERPIRQAAATPDADEEEDDQAGPVNYSLLEIASPKPEETLWNIEGVLNVSLNVQPALQPGHQVRVYFDGEPRMVNGSSFQIEEVWRGVHNIQAEILDETGKMLIRSRTNRFYVQRNTVNF
jgi:hypothetical protein